jgi:hypothetical protein
VPEELRSLIESYLTQKIQQTEHTPLEAKENLAISATLLGLSRMGFTWDGLSKAAIEGLLQWIERVSETAIEDQTLVNLMYSMALLSFDTPLYHVEELNAKERASQRRLMAIHQVLLSQFEENLAGRITSSSSSSSSFPRVHRVQLEVYFLLLQHMLSPSLQEQLSVASIPTITSRMMINPSKLQLRLARLLAQELSALSSSSPSSSYWHGKEFWVEDEFFGLRGSSLYPIDIAVFSRPSSSPSSSSKDKEVVAFVEVDGRMFHRKGRVVPNSHTSEGEKVMARVPVAEELGREDQFKSALYARCFPGVPLYRMSNIRTTRPCEQTAVGQLVQLLRTRFT